MSTVNFSIEAYSPSEIAKRVDNAVYSKSRIAFLQLVMLAILAGSFIAFGALTYTLVVTDSTLGLGPTRLLGGIGFSVGLILVIIGGAELFTGNALMVMALMDHKIDLALLLRHWLIVYAGNFIGALMIAIFVTFSGVLDHQSVSQTVSSIAQGKLELTASQALFRGILCNILVCLAVWMSFAARRISGKVLVIIFPVAVFVCIGFEHSIANMYVIPVAMIAGYLPVDISAFLFNLLFVTLGNILGGAVFVALVYWFIYLYPGKK